MRSPPRGGSHGQKERANRQVRVDHPIAPGTRVAIFSLLLGRRPFIEGRPVIVRPIPGEPHCYAVRFRGERRLRSRLVHPEFQADPEGTLAALLRDGAPLSPSILRDFELPEEPRQRGSKAPRRRNTRHPNQEVHP